MGTVPDAVKRLVDHFDQNRKVFQSPDYKEEQLPETKTPHEQESLKRMFAVADRQKDALADDLWGLTEGEIRMVGENWRG